MKRFFLTLLIMLLSMSFCFAQEEPEEDINTINSYFTEDSSQEEVPVELHGFIQYNQDEPAEQEALYLKTDETNKIKFSKPKSLSSKSLLGPQKPIFTPIQDNMNAASKFSSQEYSVRPVKTSYSKKFGKFSIGTSYDSSLSSASTNYSTGVFSKYEGKFLAVSAEFQKGMNVNSTSFSDNFSIVPELKITKHLSFLNIMQSDVNQINKKNEFVLRYTPHFKKYADDIQFELGTGQSFYEDNYVKSSLRFSTRFRF